MRACHPSGAIENGGFESGDFTGWTAEANLCVDRNTCGEYRGWQGKCFAWSGGRGEAATGRLKSKPFVLDNDGVRLLIAGWNTGPGANRSWNHVEAVDDADQEGFSMFAIDDVRTVPLPGAESDPAGPPHRNRPCQLGRLLPLCELLRPGCPRSRRPVEGTAPGAAAGPCPDSTLGRQLAGRPANLPEVDDSALRRTKAVVMLKHNLRSGAAQPTAGILGMDDHKSQ